MLAALLLLALQDGSAHPPCPFDRVLPIEITASDPILGGHGPSKHCDYTIEFSGTLHAWTTVDGDFDTCLRIEDANGLLLAEDDDSGGKPTPYARLEVEPGKKLSITVAASKSGGTGKVELHLVAAPETETTRAEAELAKQEIAEIRKLREAKDLTAARTRTEALIEKLCSVEHGDRSEALVRQAGAVSDEGDRLGLLRPTERTRRLVLEHATLALPDAHPDLQGARSRLAFTVKTRGDLGAARALQAKVLAVLEKTLPDDDHDLQLARGSLAGTIKELGDIQGARALEAKALAVLEKSLPADHPDILTARGNLAISMRDLGDLRGACALQKSVLAVRERTLPDEDGDLLTTRQSLGITLAMLGDFQSALVLQQKVLAVREKTLPDDHFFVQRARGNLALTMWSLGDFQGARVLQERVLAVCERTLPDEHPELQRARGNLANTIQPLGDLEGARALEEKVLQVFEKTLPDDHPDLQVARQNLSTALENLGDIAGARVLLEKVLDVYGKTLPDDHPAVQKARGNLAGLLSYAGDFEGARALQEKMIEVFTSSLPDDHPDLQMARRNLALTLKALEDFRGARALEEKVLADGVKTLPEDHPNLRKARVNLAWTLGCMGDRAELDRMLDSIAAGCSRWLSQGACDSPRAALVRGQLATEDIVSLLSLTRPGSALDARIFQLVEAVRELATGELLPHGELPPAARELRDRAIELRGRIQDSVAAGPAASGTEIADLVRERDVVEAELRSWLVQRGLVPPAVEVGALAQGLGEHSCAVAFRRYSRLIRYRSTAGWTVDESLVAFVVDRKGKLTRIELGSLRPVQEAVEAWRKAIGKPLERGLSVAASGELERSTAETLRRFVFDPIVPALGEARDVVVCLDDALHLVSIDSLPMDDEKSGKRLVGERYKIHVVPSLGFPMRPRAPSPATTGPTATAPTATASSPKPHLLAIGGVDFNAEIEAAPADAVASTPASARAAHSGPLGVNWGLLPETRGEVNSVGELFESRFQEAPLVLTGGKATRSAFLQGSKDARFLHIATHGYFAPETVASLADPLTEPGGAGSDPAGHSANADAAAKAATAAKSDAAAKATTATEAASRHPAQFGLWTPGSRDERIRGLAPMALCGLALAGANRGMDGRGRVPGIVTAEEIAGLDLSNCELAVLSACETNVGITRAGQGIQSLQAALHAAGAHTAITSLWKVDDESTRGFFEDFYTRIWVHKEGKATAMWNAKMALRGKGGPTRDWAAWVLTGDPD